MATPQSISIIYLEIIRVMEILEVDADLALHTGLRLTEELAMITIDEAAFDPLDGLTAEQMLLEPTVITALETLGLI